MTQPENAEENPHVMSPTGISAPIRFLNSELENDFVGKCSTKVTSSNIHHGLNDLPDEVLSNILVMDCCSPEYDMKVDRAHDVQLTNRRFRAIISTTPECWSRITRIVSLDKRLRLRGEFDVVIDRNTHTRLIAKCADRIRSLECMEDTPSGWYSCVWEFPSLGSLVIHGRGLVLRNWILPHLTRLDCCRVPLPGLFPALQQCKLEICHRGKHCSPTLEVFDDEANTANFLATTPLLRSLSLSVYENYSLRGNRHSTISLPQLRYLGLTAYTEDLFSSELLNLLDIPNLECMQVVFDISSGFSSFWSAPTFS